MMKKKNHSENLIYFVCNTIVEKIIFRTHSNECCIDITQELIIMFVVTFDSSELYLSTSLS